MKQPETLLGMIAAIYDGLDDEDQKWVDLEWEKYRNRDGAWNSLMRAKEEWRADAARLREENDALKAADRDHLAAKNGMERRLTDKIAQLELQVQELTTTLRKIGDGTEDKTFPFRAMGPDQMRQVANLALRRFSAEHIHEMRGPVGK